jgi:hypothetical protein
MYLCAALNHIDASLHFRLESRSLNPKIISQFDF